MHEIANKHCSSSNRPRPPLQLPPAKNGCIARFHAFSSMLEIERTIVKESSLGSGMNTTCSVPVYKSELNL